MALGLFINILVKVKIIHSRKYHIRPRRYHIRPRRYPLQVRVLSFVCRFQGFDFRDFDNLEPSLHKVGRFLHDNDEFFDILLDAFAIGK